MDLLVTGCRTVTFAPESAIIRNTPLALLIWSRSKQLNGLGWKRPAKQEI